MLIIYKSLHRGNTKRIAEAMGEIAGGDVFEIDDIDVSVLSGYDIIGFGSGIYFGKHHRSLMEFLDEIDKFDKDVFVFSTRTVTPLRFAHRHLIKKLKKKEANIIGEFSCRGENRVGPFKLVGGIYKGKPDENDIKSATNFIRRIMEL